MSKTNMNEEINNTTINETVLKLTAKLNESIEENQRLQYQLNIQQSKETLHKSTMEKVKKIQKDYERSYKETYDDFKQRESKIKEQYHQYSLKLQSEYASRDSKANEEITDLRHQLESRNEFINKQQKDLAEIIEKNSKNEIAFHLKQKDYELLIESKDRKQSELEQAVKSISKEATEKIQSLTEQLDQFQSKIQNTITLDDEQEQDEGYVNKREIIMTTNENNNSLQSLECSPLKKKQCGTECLNKITELEHEVYALKLENERLYNENIEKDKEINFWKGVKKDFKSVNHSNKAKELYSIKIHNLEKRVQDYGSKYNQLKGEYDKNFVRHTIDTEDLKEQCYHPSATIIPGYHTERNFNQYQLKQSIPASALQNEFINKFCYTHRTINYPTKVQYQPSIKIKQSNEGGVYLKHEGSMDHMSIKLQNLRKRMNLNMKM